LHTFQADFLVYCKSEGNRLREVPVDSLSFGEVFIETVWNRNRAFFRTDSAACASLFLDIARFSVHANFVVPYKTLDLGYFTVSQKIYVWALAHGNRPGGRDACCAVQGWKCLVELYHMPADGWFLFDEMDAVARPADVEGSLDSGYPRAHDQDVRTHCNFTARKGPVEIDSVDCSRRQGFRFPSRLNRVLGHPGAVFPDACHLEVIRIQAGAPAGAPECLFMEPWRAGCNHHPVKAQIPDVLLDHFLPGIGAHELVVSGDNYVPAAQGRFADLLYRNFAGNVRSAMAYIKPDSGMHHAASRVSDIFLRKMTRIKLTAIIPVFLVPSRFHRFIEVAPATVVFPVAKLEIHHFGSHPDTLFFAGTGVGAGDSLSRRLLTSVRHIKCSGV
jgi:hypothetical protein